MLKFSVSQFELLKKEVATAAGINSITPADCKALSFQISKKTEQRISETTLKRIYGFAFSQFKPSLFTIEVLAKYCGYRGWDDFCHNNDGGPVQINGGGTNWGALRDNAAKITNFTLQTLKNRSGIPYSQTIARAFLDDYFNDFNNSVKTGAVIAAPAGYGKTIALCHWVDEHLNNPEHENDILLFFSSSALMSVLISGRDINDWILSLLGYSADNDIKSLFDANQHYDAKFYLLIDGFDEHMIKNEQFHIILNQIVDLFSFHQANQWFKLVLSMRTNTWINNRHELDNNNIWYTGFIPDDDCINVPLFTLQEIKDLTLKINPLVQNFIGVEVAESFNHPLFFQFYYKQHKDDFTLNNVDHISIYELISMFILNKIYLGQYSTEKILLIKELVDLIDFKQDDYSIDKLRITEIIKEYNYAYHELIGMGFLRELNESDNYRYNTRIFFGNDNFLGHSIAKNILYNHGDRFNSTLIQSINDLFASSPYKMAVLKWCIIHAIKTGQQDSFAQLTEINLTSNQKAELVVFLGDLLDNESANLKINGTLMQYFKQGFSEKMFDYFFGVELINISYRKTLNTLLKFELRSRKKILVYTALALIAFINLNFKEFITLLIKLRTFSVTEYQYFAVNPLLCLEAIYQYMKYGIVKREALVDLTRFMFNPPTDAYNLKHCASNDMLYILGAATLMLSGNPQKTIRYINILKRNYKNYETQQADGHFSFFAKIFIADSYYKSGKFGEVPDLYYSLSRDYKKHENSLTPYMRTLFHALKVKVLLIAERHEEIVSEMKLLNAVSTESGSKFSKYHTARLLLQSKAFTDKYPDFKKQLRYDVVKMVRENGMYETEFIAEL